MPIWAARAAPMRAIASITANTGKTVQAMPFRHESQ